MRRLLFLCLILASCASHKEEVRNSLSLAGGWKFAIDSLDQGVREQWYSREFGDTVILPGSMASNGKGEEVSVNTDWTGDIVDRSYFTDKKYEKYRQPGNIKIPFWLKPVKYYKGAAWYTREFDLPEEWNGRRIVLFLERCHWETTVFVNGKESGSQNSLSTPHEYDISPQVISGRNIVSIRVDNRLVVPVGVNSHSVSDHTQSNWNGITGKIELRSTARVFIDDVKVFPDLQKRSAKIVVTVANTDKSSFGGKLKVAASGFNTRHPKKLKSRVMKIASLPGRAEYIFNYPMGRKIKEWSEFSPAMYRLSASISAKGRGVIDTKSVDFGMREFKANGTRFEVNGRPIFLRGTLECCIFPLTGYPPADTGSWGKILRTCKDYGLNHIRFHSWCPPEAAFIAADRLGFYFHIECGSWANQGTSIGDGGSIDRFIYDESDRITREYGNHPSFCMLAYGNEPAGKNQDEFLGKLIKYWKVKDNRRVYTSAAGWPVIPENDYNLTSEPRIQHWGEGLKSIINARPPQTMFDYRDFVSSYKVPAVSHEIGQWCVYPDFKEISEYTGVLKPSNFEIFKETLAENGMGDQAEDFLMASGKLQALCYKADIEAALRTPGFGGFQLLQLHDFPGQGTALVGILNPFFENKGYITPEEFRMFCNETVPLARIPKFVYTNNEPFMAEIEIAHFGEKPIKKSAIICRVINSEGVELFKQKFPVDRIEIGNCIKVGSLSVDLTKIMEPQKLTLEVSVNKTRFRNRWDFWVYPDIPVPADGKVVVADTLDANAENILAKGGSVLLLPYGKIGPDKGSQVKIGFSSIFWNTAWTGNQAPHTLGILCNPAHPVFNQFPTEYHSNWQWWDPVSHSQVMILDSLPSGLRPLIQPIDTWFENRKLALMFEAKAGNGKLVVCSIDLNSDLTDRPVSKQLLSSLLNYMNSDDFLPQTTITPEDIRGLYSDMVTK